MSTFEVLAAESFRELVTSRVERRANLISTGIPASVLEQGQKWAEARDPELCLSELYGYDLTPDTRRWVYALEENRQILGIGAHDCGKTWIGSAYAQGWRYYAQGCKRLRDGSGDVQGCLLALLANRAQQIMDTSYAALRLHAERAKSRGFEIPGFESSSDKSVKWIQHSSRWKVSDQTFQKPARRPGLVRQVDAAAGMKHPYNFVVVVEEANITPPEMWNTIIGWQPDLVFGCLNPFQMEGSAYSFSQADTWATVYFSWLRHPTLRERRMVIPGGASYELLETELRDVTRVQPIGHYPAIQPDPAKRDFLYALPEPRAPEREWELVEAKAPILAGYGVTEEEKPYPSARPDGLLGHPLAPVQVFRPTQGFIVGRIGEYPPDSADIVFSATAWRSSVELWRELAAEYGEPGWTPESVGGDMAEGGPDRVVFTPRHGRSAREIWRRYQAQLVGGADFTTAIEMALRCDSCGGTGSYEDEEGEWLCDCWGGNRYCRIGEPVGFAKPATGRPRHVDVTARRVVDVFGVTTYNLDSSGGGYSLAPALERLGCTVNLVAFGSSPPNLLPGQKPYLNQRASMFSHLADGQLIGAVAMTPSREVEEDCRPLRWESVERAGQPRQETRRPTKARKEAGERSQRVKLQDKAEIKAVIGRSPDAGDSVGLSEAHPRAEPVKRSAYPGGVVVGG